MNYCISTSWYLPSLCYGFQVKISSNYYNEILEERRRYNFVKSVFEIICTQFEYMIPMISLQLSQSLLKLRTFQITSLKLFLGISKNRTDLHSRLVLLWLPKIHESQTIPHIGENKGTHGGEEFCKKETSTSFKLHKRRWVIPPSLCYGFRENVQC